MAKLASQIGRRNRQRGAETERQIADILHGELGMTFKRNLEQVRTAHQGDLICDDFGFPFLIEIKRRASGRGVPTGAWGQAYEASQLVNLHPCVIYKYDRYEARAVVSFNAVAEAFGSAPTQRVIAWNAVAEAFGGKPDQPFLCDLSLPGFCYLTREIMAGRV